VLDYITPVLLTYNEEQNIGRTLSRLSWARDIVVVDSGSTDGTLNLLKAYPNVRVFNRRFDTHANQWRYAMEETQIATDWIFRLDADYQVSDALVSELEQLDPTAPVNAYRIGFDYAIFSQKLVSSLYPPKTILLRKDKFKVRGRGHTDQWDVEGAISPLSGRVVHDDWKPTGQWITGQRRYMQRESDWLRLGGEGLVDWLRRRPPLMPLIAFCYTLFGKGLIFSGRAGIFYALQRMVAEAMLSLIVLEAKLRESAGIASSKRAEDNGCEQQWTEG
jgi:glycosyltransferase involved in cell wall biosynthesis